MNEKQTELVPMTQVQAMAKAVVQSRLFPDIKNEQQAFTLMMLCQAEKLHPIAAVQRYHIIQGRPAKKAEAMLADFQAAGGRIQWTKTGDDGVAEAVFEHPSGGKNTVRFTRDDAQKAGLTGNPTWKKYESAMLRARVISAGVRMTYPAVLLGFYTPEETAYFNGNGESYEGAIDVVPDHAEVGEQTDNGTITPTIAERVKDMKRCIFETDPTIDTPAKARSLLAKITDRAVSDFTEITTEAKCCEVEDAVGKWMNQMADAEAAATEKANA